MYVLCENTKLDRRSESMGQDLSDIVKVCWTEGKRIHFITLFLPVFFRVCVRRPPDCFSSAWPTCFETVLWNAASLQRGSSARAEANRSSVNLLSKHSVLWWKPCCLTPCLYRITPVSVITVEEQLPLCVFLPFLSLSLWLISPTLLLRHVSLLDAIKLSPAHSLNMLWL